MFHNLHVSEPSGVPAGIVSPSLRISFATRMASHSSSRSWPHSRAEICMCRTYSRLRFASRAIAIGERVVTPQNRFTADEEDEQIAFLDRSAYSCVKRFPGRQNRTVAENGVPFPLQRQLDACGRFTLGEEYERTIVFFIVQAHSLRRRTQDRPGAWPQDRSPLFELWVVAPRWSSWEEGSRGSHLLEPAPAPLRQWSQSRPGPSCF